MSRAIRRHHLARMKARAKSIGRDPKYANHLQACSCWGCGNPRRHWRGREGLTLQERRLEAA